MSNFLLGDFEEALANFNDTLLYLRGNQIIDYTQLGLDFSLCSCEVLFNRGLCYIYLQQMEAGMQDLNYASKEKLPGKDHDVIDEAIKEEAQVRNITMHLACSWTRTDVYTGLHSILHPSWCRLQAE